MPSSKIGQSGDDKLQRVEEDYEEHSKQVYNYALGQTKDPQLSQEVVQDVFTSVAERVRLGEKVIDSVGGYRHRVAHNAVADAVKKLGRERRTFDSLDELSAGRGDLAVDRDSAEAVQKRLELEEIVYKCMADATEEERQIFDMYYYDDMSRADIAERLHISKEDADLVIKRVAGRLKYRAARQ
ncbi:MAG TPA: sigma-70 family RNA polymerase sigma factor [Pyrinomonadaceae bacterium]|jgi:RNA polymerase sigma factor (sigma-70 family)